MRTETALLLIMAALLTILSFTHGDEVCSALTQAKCSSITCGVETNVALTPSTTGCTCKPQDLGTRFTTCDNTTSTKTLFSYYKPPAICRAASPLPQPVTDVPCSVYCKVGERFDVSTKSCVSCPSGSYSKGANIDVRKWSPKTGLLPEMRTYCEKYTWSLGCNPWIISDEGYLESGSNRLFNNIQSVLQYRVEISEPIGTFSFEYMVSSEEFFDYLYLTIDTPETRLKVSNTKNEWLTYSFNLTQGYHVISFIYRKDASETRGFDAARIRAFSVSGISEVPTECIACEPGYFGADGKECRPCPAGTFSSGSNASECHLCPAGQSSFEGSSTCFQKSIPCQEYDYTSYFTPCDPTSKTKSEVFQWTQPQICNASHPNSTDLPETITDIACSVPEKCAPGQEPSSSTYECKYCPQGQVSDGKKCVSCPTGSASQDRLVTIQKFATRDAEVRKQFISTDCSGECSSEGWRFTDVFADSGLGNGVSDSWIDIDVSDVESKQVSVTYGLTCSVGTGSLDIEIDGAQFESIPCSGCRNVSGELSTLIIPLEKDSSKVRVNYKTRSLLSQDAFSCDRAVVTNIAIDIVDEQKGGAYQCTVCSAGEFSQSSIVCETCPPGSYSTSNSSACSECRPNTFSYEHSATCYDCGNGMVSEQGASECQWQYGQCHFNGTLFDIQREFDFEALGNILAETTASFAGEPDNTFYFNICGEKTGDRRSLKIMADDENPCAEIDGAYVCKKTKSGDVIALGRSADVRTGLYGSDLEGESGIHITFTDLSTKACLNNVTGQQENYKTIINLRCESEAERIIGPVVTTVAPCTYRIDVISNQGCPACDFNDFTALEGNCDATTLQKEIVYVKKTDKANKCAGGVEMPPKKVKCQVNVISAPYWIVAAVLGVAVLIIIALGGAALFFYYKFRDASNKFHQLSEGDENINTGRATELRD